MKIIEVDKSNYELIVPLKAQFKADLWSYRNIDREPDLDNAREQIEHYLHNGYISYMIMFEHEPVGYIVLRIIQPNVFVESLFVASDYRRKGVAGLLFDKAEEHAVRRGQPTIYCNVHPNNKNMMAFLASRGYDVLNCLEVRKPYIGEDPSDTINVGDNEFRF